MFSLEVEKRKLLLKYLKKIKDLANVDYEIRENTILFKADDGLLMFKLQKVIDAITAGFEDSSFKLLKDEYDLITIPIKRATKNDKERKRILSRIIGTKGKAKSNIAKLSEVEIIVDDNKKEVHLLGKVDNLEIAKESINRLIEGKPHGKVYSYLESQRRINKLKKLL